MYIYIYLYVATDAYTASDRALEILIPRRTVDCIVDCMCVCVCVCLYIYTHIAALETLLLRLSEH